VRLTPVITPRPGHGLATEFHYPDTLGLGFFLM
jgi:hypothetical protein